MVFQKRQYYSRILPVLLRDSSEIEEFIPLLLVAVQEVISDDDIELDLIEEYANRHNMDNEPRWLFGPTPHVSLTIYKTQLGDII